MKNRFFDVDNNIYLNSLYIVALMAYNKEVDAIEKMMLKLYLMKNPKVYLGFCKKHSIKIDKRLLYDFQYNNLQSEMQKYSLRLHIDGFNEALSYLYSKGLINYDMKQNLVLKTHLFSEINLEELPQNLAKLSANINIIFDDYDVVTIKQSIEVIERSYYGQLHLY